MQENKRRYLKAEFTGIGEVKGYTFKRIKSNMFVHLYQVDGRYYEVFKRTYHRVYNTETYPGSKQFGRIAWTFQDEDSARKEFKRLTKLYSNK